MKASKGSASVVVAQSTPLSRRQFLRAAAAVAVPMVLPSGLLAAAPNSKLCHASIGVANMGGGDLRNFLKHERVQVVALCDVDKNHLALGAKLVPDARLYEDWRELLEKEGDKIDSVNVAVPDHMHFPIAYNVIKRGKNVYCQKPMCHEVSEIRALTEFAAKKGVVTQLGIQHSSEIGDRMTVEFVRSGKVGKIKHVYLCSNRAGISRIKGPRPPQGEQPPPNLNWDLWIGTAPMRPYAPEIYHPLRWRAWQDFGTSWCGDIGCHILDATWRALDLKAPLTVTAEVEPDWQSTPARRTDTWPMSEHVTWTFAGNDRIEGSELTIDWYDGPLFLPPAAARDLDPTGKYPLEAAMLVGTEGALLQVVGGGPMLLPDEKFRGTPRPKLTPRNHYHHYVDGCLGVAKNEAHFAHSGPMAETIVLATVALRCQGQKLQWDSKAMKFPNCPSAERYLRRQYRDGWQVS